jgi:PPOX class probable F420-dependent enzyme
MEEAPALSGKALRGSGMAFEIDTSTAFGLAVVKRIDEQKVAWLTTVSSDGTPQPNPVWFLWDDGSFIIFSRPNQAKLANIARSNRVSLNLEATEDEEQITIFTGYAEIVDRESIPQEIFDRYAEKYAQGMINIKLPRAEYEQAFSVPIRVTPEKLRGW